MVEEAPRHLRHSSSTSAVQYSGDEFRHMSLEPPPLHKGKRLSKHLSMCDRRRNMAWEKRRRQILEQERSSRNGLHHHDLTDEDLSELRGSIELGFGFTEEEGQSLTHTLPALDLYFAVNRQLSSPGSSTPKSLGDRSSSFGSTKSDSDSWRICSPGDDPEQVKTKLRHWAQAVACSIKQYNPLE
ncbi:hypothetical protein K1719_024774 [Acacia pycnantha]|nr:hypothetical protein K1719_024774 [Acacia pycnantha]